MSGEVGIQDPSGHIHALGAGNPGNRRGRTIGTVTVANKQEDVSWMQFTIPRHGALGLHRSPVAA
jgi:hypothetical protein